ncbi:MAG: response regulator [Eubacterium sp.]|nr:response regulator [Eubacterium sp.]
MTTTEKKTVLMVDDNTVNLEMMEIMISDVYNLVFATNGQKALGILRSTPDIALILLDLEMPYMSGTELLMELKKDAQLKDIPVIVLANAEDNEAACLNLGAVDYIKKPFPLRAQVLEKTEKALNSPQNAGGMDMDAYINTLFAEYSTVYLVDVGTGNYDSISEDEDYISFGLAPKGASFTEALRTDAERVIYTDDLPAVLRAFDEATFIERAKQGIKLDYRMLVNGQPKHYRLKAMYVDDIRPQIIIGITSTEEEFSGMETLVAFRDDPSNFARIAQSLVSDYMCIYFVHLASNRFIEYYSVAGYERLRLDKSGDNFFTFGLKSFIDGVNPVDKERVARQVTKENILKAIDKRKAFTVSFRLTFEGFDEYVALKATKLIRNGIEYLVVGISIIDEQ